MEGHLGSHPGAELFLLVGVASHPPTVAGPRVPARSRGPSWGRQQRAEAPGQAGAGRRSEHEQRRQREEAENDECRGASIRQQRAARGARCWVNLGARRAVRQGGERPGAGGSAEAWGRGPKSGAGPWGRGLVKDWGLE